MSYHPSDDALAARHGNPWFDELSLGERCDGELQRTGLLVHEKKRSRFGENHAPRDVKNCPEKLIVVGDRVDQTADFDQTFVDIKRFAKRFNFRQHDSLFAFVPSLPPAGFFAWKTPPLCVMVFAMGRFLTLAFGLCLVAVFGVGRWRNGVFGAQGGAERRG